MERRRLISLVVGGIVTIVVFIVGMWVIAFGGLLPANDRLIMTSVALAPMAMISVCVGYAAWWATMFFLTLFGAEIGRAHV